MNDPHVQALIYRVEHRPDVDYERAPGLLHQERDFSVRIVGKGVTVELKVHFATELEAREIVEPFLRAWELDVALSRRPDELTFLFVRSEIVDRAPTPGEVYMDVTLPLEIRTYAPSAHESLSEYPPPPMDIVINSDVENMRYRYLDVWADKVYLTVAAYYCLTTLETSAQKPSTTKRNKRALAAQKFGISIQVLDEVARLSTNKGGRHGRKAGSNAPLSAPEHSWLYAALRLMIRRAAQVAHAPTAAKNQITMAELPQK